MEPILDPILAEAALALSLLFSTCKDSDPVSTCSSNNLDKIKINSLLNIVDNPCKYATYTTRQQKVVCPKREIGSRKTQRFKSVAERIQAIKKLYFCKDMNAELPELEHIPRVLYKIRVEERKGNSKVETRDIQRHLWDVKLLALFERKLRHKDTGVILDPSFHDDVRGGKVVRWRDAQTRIKKAWKQTVHYQPELRPTKRKLKPSEIFH